MAYGRITSVTQPRGTWMQEQTSLIKSASDAELHDLNDDFDRDLETAIGTIQEMHGINVMKDYKRMMESPEIMDEYKRLFLNPILEQFEKFETPDESEHQHLMEVAAQLDEAWEANKKTFITESYNVANYLPLSTLDFPALVKQYIKFLGKELMPVQTASSMNVEQRIFTKWLVNNQTGEEYEVPKIYFQREPDGTRTWKKIWNAGKGYRINDKTVLPLSTIQSQPNKKFSVFKWLLDDAGQPLDITSQVNVRTRLSYDFHINFVQYDGKKVRLPGNGIDIDIQTGGVFLNGGITSSMKLPVVDPTKNNVPTGDTVSFDDHLSGVVDFIKGTVSASACGNITGIYISGHVSNETNLRTIGYREYPSIRKFLIADGCRFQLPFTVEDFTEAQATLNFNLYNRLVQELVNHQELFEDESILEYLDEDFDHNNGYDGDVWNLESYTHTEYVDISPTSISPNFAGDPYEFRTNAIQNAITSVIYELCDHGKLDNLGFVIYANPKCTRLLAPFTTWTVSKATAIGGVKMNHTFGVLTDFDVPIRVVASNRVDAYTLIDAYQSGSHSGDKSREYFFKIVAYPMDKFHISYKHLRFARHLTNSPENASYADAQNPGGQAVLVTTSSQYETIHIQGIQGRVILKNTVLVPDSLAGLVVTGTVETYTLLTEEPDDWDSNYTSYYTKSGEDYVPVPAGSGTAPTFTENTYYKKESL